MSPLWNEEVLRRLRSAVGNRNPADARRAVRQHYLGFFQRWRGEVFLSVTSTLLGILFLCAGLLAPNTIPLSISTGFTASSWYLAACAFAGMIPAACGKTWNVPEILAAAPVSAEILGLAAHRPIQRQILLGFILPLFLTGAVFVIYGMNCAHRSIPFHPGWAVPAAVAFWLHLIGFAGTLPLLRHFRLQPEKRGKRQLKSGKLLWLVGWLVFFLLCPSLILLAPLALDGVFGPYAEEMGRVFHQILAPSGLLLWPTQPAMVPWWQLFLTIILLIAAFPAAARVWKVYRTPPVVTPDINDYWWHPGDDFDEDGQDLDPRDDGGPSELPADSVPCGKFTLPTPAAALSEIEHRKLTSRLRHTIDEHGGKPDTLFSPQTASLRERWPKIRWAWLIILLPVFAGAAWGNSIGLLTGWVWLSIHAMTVPRSDAPFCRAFFQDCDAIVPYRGLPISLNPTWRALSHHHCNTTIVFFITAVLFPLAGWLVSLMAELPGTLWPWQRYGFQGLEFHHLAATAAVVIATAGVMLRTLGPANFGDQLNNRRDRCGGWQFFGNIVWSAAFAGIAATALGSRILIAMIFGYGTFQTMPFLLHPLLAVACFAAGEGLRRLSLGLVFWQWFHARKR